MLKSTPQSVLFEGQFSKPVTVAFDSGSLTSDVGVILLAAADKKLGLTESMAAQIVDPRQLGKIQHTIGELLRQRIFGIAAGYEDCNDSARMDADPAMALACGRSPLGSVCLGSTSTLSRFENGVIGREVVGMARSLERSAVRSLKRRHPKASRIVIDLAPSVGLAHGVQQGVLFNGFYDTWCYLPMFGFLSVERTIPGL
ncbi:MAG: hypothetical protein GY930_08205 [bacterium]|nr:hypothetical protein [bacterium]